MCGSDDDTGGADEEAAEQLQLAMDLNPNSPDPHQVRQRAGRWHVETCGDMLRHVETCGDDADTVEMWAG